MDKSGLPRTEKELVAEEYGFELPSEPEITKKPSNKTEELIVETSFLETPEYILEQIATWDDTDDWVHTAVPENTAFLRFNKTTEDTDIVPDFIYKNKLFKPIRDEVLEKGGITLPTGVKDYKDTAEILEQIREFLKFNVELEPFYEGFFPNLALFYWTYEKFPFIPYVHFVGRTGTGKSTAMEVFGSICYKPIDTTGSLTIASMFRVATMWKGTLLIDEFERVGEHAREITSFLKSGVSNRLVLRTEGEKEKKVRAYIVKAPKLFTSENPITDAGLQSRTIVVKMEKNKRRIPLFKLPHYYKEASEIRNKLLLWRLRNLNKIDLSEIEYGFPELAVFDSRVQQVITPIFYFSDTKTRELILKFTIQQEEETKQERRENLDGKIFEIILEKSEAGEELLLTRIAEELNQGTKFPISERKIAGVTRTNLRFEVKKTGTGTNRLRRVILEGQEERIKELCLYYGLPVPSVWTLETQSSHSSLGPGPIREKEMGPYVKTEEPKLPI